MTTINHEVFKKEGFTFEEIESIEKGITDINNGDTISYEKVKVLARKKIFSNAETYV